MEDALQQTLNEIGAILPEVAAFLLILIVGYIVARTLATLTDKGLETVGFDRVVQRSSLARSMRKADQEPSDLLANIVKYAVMLFTLQLAFGVFGTNPISQMLNDLVAYLPKVFVAVVIVVLAGAIATAARDIVRNSLAALSYGNLLGTMAAGLVTAVGVFAALDVLEIAPTIVNGLFYGSLAIIVGVTVIAVGGGGIQPMRARWEKTLATYDQEKEVVAQAVADRNARIDRQQGIQRARKIDLVSSEAERAAPTTS